MVKKKRMSRRGSVGQKNGKEGNGVKELKKCDPESVCRVLDAWGISYERLTHSEVRTMDDCKAVEERIGAPVCKNLFLQTRQGTEYFLLLLEGDKRFRTAEVSKKLGRSRLSFGSEEKLYALLGVRPGAISPMGLIHDGEREVQLIIDRDVLSHGRIAVHPCVNTQTVAMATRDFVDIFLPRTGHVPQVLEITGADPSEKG
ncbi:prolyl-tRNA synthetase associated domain-containing protein [Zongyangia hominis]|uniref:Prolyl-tRNA synthetase associated domain-containing protein n=1 Tax=Zongyangia hominis TaxID=2763677 RepID=A0A926EDD4_9FIRM|nr:prolyl-tRNA synthetase associated domain-containing protein [Zongyangia hominis]MBC8570349.1 prolyl-tRNA synthetase associated domain-containing protein [Zongyangia hominis]